MHALKTCDYLVHQLYAVTGPQWTHSNGKTTDTNKFWKETYCLFAGGLCIDLVARKNKNLTRKLSYAVTGPQWTHNNGKTTDTNDRYKQVLPVCVCEWAHTPQLRPRYAGMSRRLAIRNSSACKTPLLCKHVKRPGWAGSQTDSQLASQRQGFSISVIKPTHNSK